MNKTSAINNVAGWILERVSMAALAYLLIQIAIIYVGGK